MRLVGSEMCIRDRDNLFFSLEPYDDQGDVEAAIDIAQKIVADKPDLVLGHMNSDTTIIASPIYAQANMLHLTPSAINSNLTAQGFSSLFRTVSSDRDQTRFLAKFYNQDVTLQKKPILIVHTFANVSLDFSQNFHKELTLLNIPSKVVSISDLETNFDFLKPELKQYERIAFFAKDFLQLESFLKYIQKSEFKNHIIFSRFDCETRVARIKTKIPSVYCVAGKTSAYKSTLTKRFYEKFKEKYNETWFDNGLSTYQTINLLPSVIRQTASLNSQLWGQALHQNGAYLQDNTRYVFDEKGDLLNPPLLIQKVEKGQFSIIWHTE
jgi:branched-chain amino acid transport system substrate-binding protein